LCDRLSVPALKNCRFTQKICHLSKIVITRFFDRKEFKKKPDISRLLRPVKSQAVLKNHIFFLPSPSTK